MLKNISLKNLDYQVNRFRNTGSRAFDTVICSLRLFHVKYFTRDHTFQTNDIRTVWMQVKTGRSRVVKLVSVYRQKRFLKKENKKIPHHGLNYTISSFRRRCDCTTRITTISPFTGSRLSCSRRYLRLRSTPRSLCYTRSSPPPIREGGFNGTTFCIRRFVIRDRARARVCTSRTVCLLPSVYILVLVIGSVHVYTENANTRARTQCDSSHLQPETRWFA